MNQETPMGIGLIAMTRMATLLAGLALIAASVRRRSILGKALLSMGTGLAYRAVKERKRAMADQSPAARMPDESMEWSDDPVDEALMESFPASDPPAFGRVKKPE